MAKKLSIAFILISLISMMFASCNQQPYGTEIQTPIVTLSSELFETKTPSPIPTPSQTSTPSPTLTITPSPTSIDIASITSPIIKNAYLYYFENKDVLYSGLPIRTYLFDMMPHKEIYWPFLVYEPSVLKSKNLLVTIPNTGNPNFQDDDNFIAHYNASIGALDSARREADEIGAILLVPVFPRFSIPHTFGAQYLSRFTLETDDIELRDVDKQLIYMADFIVDQFAKKDISLSKKLLFTGYSAQSWFSSRFVALNPTRVQAVAIGGCAWPTVPVSSYEGVDLPFPLGLGAIEDYGKIVPNIEDYGKVKVYIYWGTMDGYLDDGHWDFGPISHGYQHYGNSKYNAWFFQRFGRSAEELFNSNKEIFESVTSNVEFKLFVGLDHHQVFEANYNNAIQFLKQNAEYFE
jgi:hypothetical protein